MNLSENEYKYLFRRAAQLARTLQDDFHAQVHTNIANFIEANGGVSKSQLYVKQVKDLSKEIIETMVSEFIAGCRELSKFPDRDDINKFCVEARPSVIGVIRLWQDYKNDPFGESLHPEIEKAISFELENSLQTFFGRGIEPLNTFFLEGLAVNDSLDRETVNSGDETDDLLSILPKRRFNADLEDAIANCSKGECPLACVFIDLDHFKRINDNHGHPFGDEVLIGIANVVKKHVGQRGSVYRYGGEEICTILPNHTADEAALLAERIRIGISRTGFSKSEVSVTASFGVAEYPANGNTSNELVSAADSALYKAKELGRDLVWIVGEDEPKREGRDSKSLRKLATPKGVSSEQLEKVRFDYFKTGRAVCPFDGIPLVVQSAQIYASGPHDLEIQCPYCGFEEYISG